MPGMEVPQEEDEGCSQQGMEGRDLETRGLEFSGGLSGATAPAVLNYQPRLPGMARWVAADQPAQWQVPVKHRPLQQPQGAVGAVGTLALSLAEPT